MTLILKGIPLGQLIWLVEPPPEGEDPCRKMTIRPSECAEKMASTMTSFAEGFVVGRGR